MKFSRFLAILLSILLILCTPTGATSTGDFASYDKDSIPAEAYFDDFKDSEGKLTIIVEVEGDSVLESLDSGTDNTKNRDSEYDKIEAGILNSHMSVMSEISASASTATKPIATYTAIFNGFAIKADYEDIEKIKAANGVKNVYIAGKFRYEPYLTNSLDMIEATGSEASTYTGKGQLIAIIDSEFNVEHNFFKADPLDAKYTKDDIANKLSENEFNASADAESLYVRSKVPFAYDYGEVDTKLFDTKVLHGTHVAGIAGGKGGTYGGKEINGAAPDAQLAFMKVTNGFGEIKDEVMLAALDDAAKLGADVINISLGADYVSPYADGAMQKSISNAHKAGISVIAASGNNKRGFWKKDILVTDTDYSASGVPAQMAHTTSVASAQNTSAEQKYIAESSSYGVSENLELKPEITAPGASIVSSYATSKQNGTVQSNSTYIPLSGTSMAAPHIAGMAACMREYLKNSAIKTEGKNIADLAENLMMTSAKILYPSSSDVPYTPRVQGAGLVSMENAIKNKVIIKGTDGTKAKLSLKDGITDTLNINFVLENLSSDDVSFDMISAIVITDAYKPSGGKYYIDGSKALTVKSHTLPSEIHINSGASADFNAQLVLDDAELADNAEVFTNGFFIDGFIKLESTSSDVAAISVPFTAYRGDWTDGSLFDKTMYDEGGSSLIYTDSKGNVQVSGTFLFSNTYNDKGIPTTIKLGYHIPSKGFDDSYIAISPNNDGYQDSLELALTSKRAVADASFTILDSSKTALDADKHRAVYGGIFSKFRTEPTNFISRIIPTEEGNYYLKVDGRFNYSSAEPHWESFEIPFYVDNTEPEIISMDFSEEKDNSIQVRFKDDRYMDRIAFVNTQDGMRKDYYLTSPSDGSEYGIEFDLSIISSGEDKLNDTYVLVYDKAGNTWGNSLTELLGDIRPQMTEFSYKNNTYTTSFDMISYKPNQMCDIMYAFYNDDGELIHIKIQKINVLKGKGGLVFSGYADLSKASIAKLFFLKSGTMTPYDISKQYSVAGFVK